MKALGISERRGFHRLISQQIHYSLQARDAENELVPISIDQGVGILVWSPLAGGLLSGKYRRGQQTPEGTRHFNKWGEPPIHDENKLYDIIEAIVAIAEGHKVSAAQIALAYLLGRPAVTSIIIGARTEEQLIDNLAAASITLTAEERARLDAVSQPVLLYPYWHQAKTAKERLSKADLSLLAPYLEGYFRPRVTAPQNRKPRLSSCTGLLAAWRRGSKMNRRPLARLTFVDNGKGPPHCYWLKILFSCEDLWMVPARRRRVSEEE